MDILVVDDEKIVRDAVQQIVENQGHYCECASTGDLAVEAVKSSAFDAVLLDLNLGSESGLDILERLIKASPRLAVVLFTAAGSISTAVEAMRRGALDYLEKPFTSAQLGLVLSRVQQHGRLARRVAELEVEVASHRPATRFETADPAVKEVLDVLFRAAPTPASILILGESGTGKTVAARAVHDRSPRTAKPFVTVNCPGLSRELLESELFGHVKGAFTGAIKDHWGKVKAAEGGTLFLDEIGELPLDIQPKLLRLLQDREYERVGENSTRQSDVRVIAATNRDLARSVAEGTFREDLYYRLNVITVSMPPLRERPRDLERFAQEYVGFFSKSCGLKKPAKLNSDGSRALAAYSWPGNLRELRNVVERAVILARDGEIGPGDLPLHIARPGQGGTTTGAVPALRGAADIVAGMPISLAELEEAHIRKIMARSKTLADAAATLGIDQATLYRKRKRLEEGKEGG